MSDIAIKVENLGKRYRINAPEKQTHNRRETIRRLIASPFRHLLSTLQKPSEAETLWALRDVSFQVNEGEIVGIIGRNGAGKSTMLKILSRITKPTTGQVELYGRVGSLLEVGTGFHPELTGRENVYLNGAIMGMRKAEIDHKFDEIVEFAGVANFIDMPVKRYSSGMSVRLAFAVAAHLEPEILLIDEVLAVGDIAFQKKCFDKMEQVGQQGITILVVSHNMALVTRLCERAILLNSGQIQSDGPVMEAVGEYLASNIGTTSFREWDDIESAPGNDVVRLKSIKALSSNGVVEQAFDIRFPIALEFEYWVLQDDVRLHPAFFFLDESGSIIFMSGGMHDPEWMNYPRPKGLYKSRCWIPGNFLAEGTFIIHAIVHTLNSDKASVVHVYEKEVISLQVYDSLAGDSARGQHRGAYYGVVRPILNWETTIENKALREPTIAEINHENKC